MACTRCGRPVCPECMTPAAVGFQCPECVAEGRATQRAPRTITGAALTGGEARVTQALVGLSVLVFVVQLVLRAQQGQDVLLRDLALQPFAIAAGEPWRLLTAAALHASVLHLLFNMYALALVGPALEGVLGRWRYLLLYALSALAGSAASYALNDPQVFGVGASGAVFGLFGAHYVVTRRLGGDTTQITVLLGLNLAIGFLVPRIDWQAHLGGLAAGALLALALVHVPPGPRRTAGHLVAAAALTLVVLGVVAARTQALREAYGLG